MPLMMPGNQNCLLGFIVFILIEFKNEIKQDLKYNFLSQKKNAYTSGTL